jgi:hypothetical protein
MFDFLRRTEVHTPSETLTQALSASGLPAGTGESTLGVVESRGSYSGRKVTYFRVFDQARVKSESVDVYKKRLFPGAAYAVLDAHPELVLRAGFREQDGAIVIYAQ